MDLKAALGAITEGRHLTRSEMTTVMRHIMTGQATPAQIGGFLIGLRMKGETVDEITAAAQLMRELAAQVPIEPQPYLVDIVGTGGDGVNSFNVSTTSAFVVAAAGGRVAKHGNRSVSSQCGSADVLEALGAKIELTADQVAQCVQHIGIGFMFAPLHHSAMRFAVAPRREMGVRTLFNLLGPLTNPAQVPHQLVGVFKRDWVEPLAQVLKQLGSQHVLVVHSEDGLDEISIAAPTLVAELHQETIHTYTLTPEAFALKSAALSAIRVHSIAESVAMLRHVLSNQAGPPRDMVVLNAGAAIYAAGLVTDLNQGIQRAQTVLNEGAALAKLSDFIQFTQKFN